MVKKNPISAKMVFYISTCSLKTKIKKGNILFSDRYLFCFAYLNFCRSGAVSRIMYTNILGPSQYRDDISIIYLLMVV